MRIESADYKMNHTMLQILPLQNVSVTVVEVLESKILQHMLKTVVFTTSVIMVFI